MKIHKGITKRRVLNSFAFLGFLLLLCFLFFPEKTVDTVFGNLSEIEFRLLARVSPWLSQKSEFQRSRLSLGSHRGFIEKSSVENSRQSIEAAIKNGFECLEVDISFSSDLKPYLFHGPDLELVGMKGKFSEYSSNEIDRWRLLNHQPVISLGRFCYLYANRFEKIYLDVKGDNSHYKKKAHNLAQELENYATHRFVVIGTPWRVVKNVKRALPRVNVGFEQKGAIANYLLGADTVSLYYKYEFSLAEYKLAKLLGLNVVVWTVNDLKLLKDYSQKYRLTVLTDLNKQEINLAGQIL